ncbi:MAG: L,D-transpeptidase family protein [Arenicellales bacterium]|nr:L,D-transpeptidase family protein [Arenicellales bacterium]
MKRLHRHFFAVCWTLCVAVPAPVVAQDRSDYEGRLLEQTAQVLAGNWQTAESGLSSLLAEFPTSRVGHLLRADLLAALAGPNHRPASISSAAATNKTAALLEQLRVRWQHRQQYAANQDARFPARLLVTANSTPVVVYLDLPASRLYVFGNQDGQLRQLADFYATIGSKGFGKEREGDLKTPVGVYRITSYIPGRRLDARYGPGALTTDYPNALDQTLSRTGSGIWLHGTEPGWVNRAPRASEGCVTLSDIDFNRLYQLTGGVGTYVPVIIDDKPEWLLPNELLDRRRTARSIVQNWHHSWLQGDTKALAHYYSTSTSTPQSIPSSTQAIWLGDRTEIFGYPGQEETLLARIVMDQSAGASLELEQYWRRSTTGHWQIVAERQSLTRDQRQVAAGITLAKPQPDPGA